MVLQENMYSYLRDSHTATQGRAVGRNIEGKLWALLWRLRMDIFLLISIWNKAVTFTRQKISAMTAT